MKNLFKTVAVVAAIAISAASVTTADARGFGHGGGFGGGHVGSFGGGHGYGRALGYGALGLGALGAYGAYEYYNRDRCVDTYGYPVPCTYGYGY